MKLNLGCGYNKEKGYVNIDNRHECEPDMVIDVTKGLPFGDDSIEEVRAVDFLEHLERQEVMTLIDEIWRILKPNGVFFHRTPSTDGRGAFQDPFHRSFWNINTWKFYFTDVKYRKLYGTKANFKIIKLEDYWTDMFNKVIHTYCEYAAIK